MCGRYGLYDVSESELLTENRGYNFKPNYNVAPTHTMPVITNDAGNQSVQMMQWGIGRRIGPDKERDIFNTRSEKAFDRFWGKTVRNNRCLVPANGFYEWQKTKDGKQPYWISMPGHSLLYFAGIFDTDSLGKTHYSIMTTNPNLEMERLHDRMPVILRDDEQDAWLFAENDEADMLEQLLGPLPNSSLHIYQVGKEVNTVKNNYGELLKPVNSQ